MDNANIEFQKAPNNFQLPSLFDSFTDVVWILNKSGIIQSINKAVANAWGYLPEKMKGKSVFNFIPKNDRQKLKNALNDFLHSHFCHPLQIQIYKCDQAIITVVLDFTWNETQQIFFGFVKEIPTEEKFKEVDLINFSASMNRHSGSTTDVLERISDGFFSVDEYFKITYWNKKSEEVFGVSKEKVMDKYFWDLFPDCNNNFIYRQSQRSLQENIAQEFEAFYEPLDSWFRINLYPSARGISVLFKNINEKKRLERELHEKNNEHQKMLTAAVIKAEEKVRTEIGRELHDNINQILTSVKLYTELSMNEEAPNKNMLQKSAWYLTNCIQQIGNISKKLSAPTIGKIGLLGSITDLIDLFRAFKKMQINLNTSGLERPINQEIHTALYRIVQEQLANIFKHSEATNVDILIIATDTNILMQIKDNGKGFDMQQKGNGIGIATMTSRAEALKGFLKIKSSPGAGCLLLVEFPLHSL